LAGCAEVDISPELVAKAVSWQLHWDGDAGLTSKSPATITFKRDEKSEVWVDELNWVISFDERNGNPYPYFLQRVTELPDEMKQLAPLPFIHIKAMSARLPAYTNTFLKISKINAATRKKLLATVQHEACNAEMLSFYKDNTHRPIEKLHFWIAPVDTNFPVVLYIIEGAPYIGKVYYGTHTLKPLYSEFNYISDNPKWRAANQKLMARLRSEGDEFHILNGQLLPTVHYRLRQ
jgi:hypothetical protein